MNRFASLVAIAALAVPAAGQDKGEATKAGPRVTAVRLQVVLSRLQGDRKVASRPYSFTFSTQKNFWLRQGTEVPVPVMQVEKDGKDVTSFQYKNVGANMEFTAERTDGERYLVGFNVEDSSLWDDGSGRPKPGTPQAPAFNTVTMRGQLLLRDGETAASTTSNAVTGEITKLEITFNVLK